ncbi:hypothetical protein, partial [Prevotella sp.]|uniref:hypothetical protein n=1 Tax=Prevotella sp. TaxID=59823 RepID=UPI003AF73154
ENTKSYTLQEVFYRLYDDYVAAERAWSEKQHKKKEALRKIYPDTSEENNALFHKRRVLLHNSETKIAYRVQRQKSFPLYAIIL